MTEQEKNQLIERVKNFRATLPADKQGFIKHINGETKKIVLNNGVTTQEVSIEDLEAGKFNFDTFSFANQEKIVQPIEPVQMAQSNQEMQTVESAEQQPVVETPVQEAPVIEEPIEQLGNEVTPNTQSIQNLNNKLTLNDVKTLVELNNKETLDNVIKSFAVGENGEVDIKKAITTVLDNSSKEAIDSIVNGKSFPTELYKFDVIGNIIVPEELSTEPPVEMTKQDIIDASFNNVLVYFDVANMYNISFSEEQKQGAKQGYISQINANLQAKGYVEPTPVVTPEAPVEEQAKAMTYAPVPETKAGFADIFILSVIVLVYAAIIVNLVLKLK